MSSLSDDIKKAFQPSGDLARVRIEAAKTLNRDEHKSFKKISEKFDAQRRYLRRAFELDYGQRVAVERRRLINKAGSIKRDFVPRFLGNDGFNKDVINRQAQINVRTAHRNDLASIDRRETEAIRTLVENAQSRVALREKPIKDFQKSVDRRSGVERRKRNWSR